MRVAIYARVSTTNGRSPEMQLSDLREYASRRGWDVFAEYVDNGVSGAKESRPETRRTHFRKQSTASGGPESGSTCVDFGCISRQCFTNAGLSGDKRRLGLDFVSKVFPRSKLAARRHKAEDCNRRLPIGDIAKANSEPDSIFAKTRAAFPSPGLEELWRGFPRHRCGEKLHERHHVFSGSGHAAPKPNLRNHEVCQDYFVSKISNRTLTRTVCCARLASY
jgi:hypothetical protein